MPWSLFSFSHFVYILIFLISIRLAIYSDKSRDMHLLHLATISVDAHLKRKLAEFV